MIDYQKTVLERFGYHAGRGCGQADVCPAFSLPDLFSTRSSRENAAEIDALLDAVPAYFSQSVITTDRRTATLAFGLRLMSLERQQRVIDTLRAELDRGRPPGVRAVLAGLPVLASEANAKVSSDVRRLVTLLAGLGAVALVLLVALRGVARARATRADRAGDRLVGARAVRAARAAEPDVGRRASLPARARR